MNRDRVIATFLGTAIGDALGKPVESKKADEIAEKHGLITKYLDCTGHKYFDGDLAGGWTDDTQLTLAVARAMIPTKSFDLDAIAVEHQTEFKKSVLGWGGTTKEAVARMLEGVSWKEASRTDKDNRGLGNGVCMKVAPVGIYMAATNPDCAQPQFDQDVQNLARFAVMTHRTSIGITSGIAHAFAVMKCLKTEQGKLNLDEFIGCVVGAAEMGRRYLPKTIKDDLGTRFALLYDHEKYDTAKIITDMGGGTCYVFDSLPFTYMFFVKNPNDIQSLYECASAGGDTDTNASMLGGLLGALHGTKIFPQELVDGLDQKQVVLDTAEQFCDAFGIK